MPSSPQAAVKRTWLAAFYPAVWRWHFWAGLLVTPVLIVLSITGAFYVFQDELNAWAKPELHRVNPPAGAIAKPYAERIAAARAALSGEWDFATFNQSPDPTFSDEITFERDVGPPGALREEHHFVHVDPYTARVLGSYAYESSFFGVVILLHTQLLAGKTGQFIIEATTCWSIVSLLTGLLLWWPRAKEKLWGVWLPRLRKGSKFALRDLHTIPGLYLFAAIFVIMFTGLLYTPLWGKAAFAGLYFGGQLPTAYVSPPKSTPLAAGSTPVSADAVVAEARRHYAYQEFRLQAPHHAGDAWAIYGPTQTGDLDDGVVYVDASTGKTLATIDYPSLKAGAKTALMFYSIHTGSVFGLTTKIIAVIACLITLAMSATGVWMWWRRRPVGKFGSPRKPKNELIPRSAVAVIIGLAIFFPLVGLTIVLFWLVEFGSRYFRRKPVA